LRRLGLPSSFVGGFGFCSFKNNPGAFALKRIPASAICTASHCVNFLMAALAALYAGTLLIGLGALMEDMLMTTPDSPTILFENTCVGINVPMKLRFMTNLNPLGSRLKKVVNSSLPRSPISNVSFVVLPVG